MRFSESNTWTDRLLAGAFCSREEDGLFLVEDQLRRKPGLATARTGGASCANPRCARRVSPRPTTKDWGEGQGEGRPSASLLHTRTALPARPSRGEGADSARSGGTVEIPRTGQGPPRSYLGGSGVPTPPQTGASPSSPGGFFPSKGAPGASPPPSPVSVLAWDEPTTGVLSPSASPVHPVCI
jgi:hypothetical protein